MAWVQRPENTRRGWERTTSGDLFFPPEVQNDPVIQQILAQYRAQVPARKPALGSGWPKAARDAIRARIRELGIKTPAGMSVQISPDGRVGLNNDTTAGEALAQFAPMAIAVFAGAGAAGAFAGGSAAGAAGAIPSLTSTVPTTVGTIPAWGAPGLTAAGTAATTAAAVKGGMSAWEAINLGLALGGGALDIIGRLRAGAAAKAQADFNARIAEMQAADALARGAEEEGRFRQGVESLIGSQRAGFAGQNVDVGYGSPVDVQADAAFLGELDALTIRSNARREAWGYEVQAENFRRGGDVASSSAKFGAVQSALGIGQSLLMSKYGWGRANA